MALVTACTATAGKTMMPVLADLSATDTSMRTDKRRAKPETHSHTKFIVPQAESKVTEGKCIKP